jgi:hypothetical protein
MPEGTRLLASFLSLTLAGCGASSSSGSAPGADGGLEAGSGEAGSGEAGVDAAGDVGPPPVEGGPGAGAIKTIFLILMENTNWSGIKGSGSAPYINGTLLPMSSYCDNYFDTPKKVHPSEPNYIWLEAGDNLLSVNDDDPKMGENEEPPGTAHLTTLMTQAGLNWKEYAEDIDGKSCPLVSSGNFAVKHVPFLFFADDTDNFSATSATCMAHVRPYTELVTDLANGTVAQYNFITPNLCDDMHNLCSLDQTKQGDMWLSTEIPKIMSSSAYKNGGAIFITWDESELGEYPIGMIVLSPLAKGGGYVSHTKYYHSSMLRTAQEVFGTSPLLRDAANQPNLSDLFTTYP